LLGNIKTFFAYIRVSTLKQGDKGVSLQEQRNAIVHYARKFGLEIGEWFEEKETAAKRGRPVFNRMLKLLKQAKATGVIIHKIDRSARNLRDWADLGELIDQGIEVHFANESLDLHSRGGRLSADIQAVVASDFIRNLREETRKGMYGRFKQGLYPLGAPLGYLDRGKGAAKEPDPAMSPLVKKTFETYATEKFNLKTLADEMYRQGLRNRRGGKVTRNGMSVLLNNPFYIGIIRVRRTNETFVGVHKPIISKALFDSVQAILSGKIKSQGWRHNFLFRRILACKACGLSLIGEVQKGYTYYRCHTTTCQTTCLREEIIEQTFLETFSGIELSNDEIAYARQRIEDLKKDWHSQKDIEIRSLNLRLNQLQDRLSRLTDAFIDRVIEKDIFEERKIALLMERKEIEEKLAEMRHGTTSVATQILEFLELAASVNLNYKIGTPEEKRDLLKSVTSNRQIDGKTPYFKLAIPFSELANRFESSSGVPDRDIPRTAEQIRRVWDKLFPKLLKHFQSQQGAADNGT
jgi:DNA invertase Pin-like site-specific DNA recombinase